MKTGLYFGSFNPVHIGHMAIANHIAEFCNLDEIWFVVSPQNPLKEKAALLDDYTRLELVSLAIGDDPRFKTSSIEFSLPKPSYTINTLLHLKEKHPKHIFYLIMGADNYSTIHKWKNYREILDNYVIIVYPRPGIILTEENIPANVTITNAPLMEISSRYIRNAIKSKKNVRHFLPPAVFRYISEMHLYE